RGYDMSKLEKVIDILCSLKPLPKKYKDHALSGNYITYRECHIEPDWLLVYKIENNTLTLVLSRTGTHSDLFN
ncbi:type II toxin-antitoxin system YafQ family toxin, partial [bacterium]|nr:type II toxin-antitoxin system YafQ family toxin [bacterium]